MSILTKAVDELKYRIPNEILNQTFKPNYGSWRQSSPISIDQEILNKVIKPRVIVDTNIVGGQIAIISLLGLAPEYIDTFSMVYHIPPDRLNNRMMVSVLSAGLSPYGAGNVGAAGMTGGCSNDLISAGNKVGASFATVPLTTNASVELIGRSSVLIRDSMHPNYYYTLRCVVANEENMGNINPRSWHVFSRLCELAVKSYIYTTMLIRIDQAFLSGGQELGSFKSYVEGLSDSEEMYQQYLKETWQAVNFMNSTADYSRFIRMQISPGI
jgi:hypothetical protein